MLVQSAHVTHQVGHNCICTPYMTVCKIITLLKIPYTIYTLYIRMYVCMYVWFWPANPTDVALACSFFTLLMHCALCGTYADLGCFAKAAKSTSPPPTHTYIHTYTHIYTCTHVFPPTQIATAYQPV